MDRRVADASLRALASVLMIALIALFYSASTGCSGGPGAPGQASLAQSHRGTVYYLDDHLGSAQVVADAATGAIYEYAVYPYGLDGSSSTSASASTSDPASAFDSDYSYTTKERDDETGLIYFGRRYYSPSLGRWITPDPLFLEDVEKGLENPVSNNLYAYARNNPTLYVDPDGAEEGVVYESVWSADRQRLVETLPPQPIDQAALHKLNMFKIATVAIPAGALSIVALSGAAVGASAVLTKVGVAYEATAYYGAMKTMEVASKVMTVDKFLPAYQMAESFFSGYTRADAPSDWWEFVGSAVGHGWAIEDRYDFVSTDDLEFMWNEKQKPKLPIGSFDMEEKDQ